MKEKDTLILLVADYPNPKGEPFLEEELKILSKQFNHIYIIQTSHSDFVQSTSLFLPDNAKVFAIKKNKGVSFYTKLRYFFSVLFWYQLALAFLKHHVSFSFSIFKLINYYLTNSANTLNYLSKFIDNELINLDKAVFYSYWCDEHTFALARLKQMNKSISFVTRVHGWDLYFDRHMENFLPFREYIFKNASKIFPISKDGRRYLLNKKLSAEPDKIITSFLGVQKIATNPNFADVVDDSSHSKVWRVLTLSHINSVKRLDKLADALLNIPSSYCIEWHHIGWGESQFEQEFKEKVFTLFKNREKLNVIFHGMFSKNEVQVFLETQPIDVIINCSDTEGIPVSLMEASSAGIPSIAFNVGGVPAVVRDKQNGFLLDADKDHHVSQLTNALEKYFLLSKESLIEMSNEAKNIWEREFNVQNNFSHFAEQLKTLNQSIANYLECSRCLINSKIHPAIVLNKYGECDICEIIDKKNNAIRDANEQHYFQNVLKDIKNKGRGKIYDCVIGISGGVDSAYLAIKMKEMGLNPLLVHVDNGWNSEIAVSNIESLVTTLGFDLYTVVIDWEEIQDIVKSFMKASVIDIDWANEMCFVSSLYKIAKKFGIKSILTGHQLSSEGWMPETVVHYKLDLINFKAIHRKFGNIPLKTYPTIGYFKSYLYSKILGIHYYYPLDYIGYDKELAKKELINTFGWRDYGQKHFESIFTRFYQAYILPKKFGIDKRIFHYSSLVTSGQLLRSRAKEMLENDEYFTSGQFLSDKVFIQKKLGFTESEFDAIINAQPKSHFDYPSLLHLPRKITRLKKTLMGL